MADPVALVVDGVRHLAGRIARGPRVPVQTVADFARQHPSRWFEGHPAQPHPAFAPRRWGAPGLTYPVDPTPIPPLGAVDLTGGGAVVGLAGWAVSPEHCLLGDLRWSDAANTERDAPRRRYPTTHLAGTCLSIASDCAAENYGHFLLDSLPRLGIAAAAGFAPDGFDRIVLAPLPPGVPVTLLERAGLRAERLAPTRLRHRFTADRLLATSLPGRPMDYPASTARYLRSLAPDDIAEPSRRLFVRRFGIRELGNEAELLEIAARFGFEAYDYRTAADPPRDFAEARIVVGAHGATLANIAFCVPGTLVLEITPTDHVRTYYYTLARAAGHAFHYLAGQSASLREAGVPGPGRSPVWVDPQAFTAALRHLVDCDGGIV